MERKENDKFLVTYRLKLVLNLFEGEKTNTFYVGLVALGYSIYQFFTAFYFTFFFLLGFHVISDSYLSLIASQRITEYIPNLFGGIIFLIIGIYLMKVGVKKETLFKNL